MTKTALTRFFERHRTIVILAFAYGTTRLLAALFLQLTFAGFGPAFGNFLEQGRFTAGGAYPFLDYWDEYPPMFPWLNVTAYSLSSRIPGDQVLWFGTFERWVLVPFDVGSLILVYAIARKLGSEENALRASFLYVASFVTIYVPLGWFDALPLFWLLLVVYFAVRDNPAWTGIAAGLGFLSKPIPVLALPMAWMRMSGVRSRLTLVFAALLAVILPLLPFALLRPDLTLAHFRNLGSVPSWETVWALIDGYHSYGLAVPLDQRFDPNSAVWQTHPVGAYTLWVTIAFGLVSLYLWTRRIDWRDKRRSIAFVGLTWSLFALWSRGYSPQWDVNFIPFIVLLMPNIRGVTYLALLGMSLVAEWPIAFTLAANQQWYLDAIVIWRTALFLLLSVDFGIIALAKDGYRRKLHLAFAGFVGVLVVAGGLIGVRALRGYFDHQLANEPLRSAVHTLQSSATEETGLVCREISVCERIAPFVPGVSSHWLPTPNGWQAQLLPEFARTHPDLWLIEPFDEESGHDFTVERWLGEQYGKVSQQWIDGARVSRFVALELVDVEQASAIFGDQIRLTGHAEKLDGRYLSVLLIWQTEVDVDIPYKVFVHVRDATGELVAQNDQLPAGGFSSPDQWTVGSSNRDLHGVILPPDTQPGYRIQVGWYDPETGERLPLTASDDGGVSDVYEIEVQNAPSE